MNQPFRRGPFARRAAFTLLEMIIVVAILGLLFALVGPRLVREFGTSKVKITKGQIEMLSTTIETLYRDVGRYPTREEGLKSLVERPTDMPEEKWKGPYLSKKVVPLDAWGTAFEYDTETPDDEYEFVIRSFGADGKKGGEGEDADLSNRS